MVERQRKVADIVRKDPAVDYVNSTVGAGGPNSLPNSGRMLVALKPQTSAASSRAVLARLRREANVVTGIEIFFQPIQNINLGGKLAKSQYQYTLQSNDTDDALSRGAGIARPASPSFPALRDVTTDLYIKNPQITRRCRPREGGGLRRHRRQVRQELYNAFGTRQVATIYTPANDYEVILETMPEYHSKPERPQQHLSQDHRTARWCRCRR